MSESVSDTATRQAPSVDKSQYLLAAALFAVGVYTIVDARGLNVGFGDPVGPRVFPYLIGAGMIVLAVLLAIATARGDVAQAEAGEDIDLEFLNWRGVLAPPEISEERKDELIGYLEEMHDSEGWQAALDENGWTDDFKTGEEFATFIDEQDARVSGTLQDLGLL